MYIPLSLIRYDLPFHRLPHNYDIYDNRSTADSRDPIERLGSIPCRSLSLSHSLLLSLSHTFLKFFIGVCRSFGIPFLL